MPWIMVASLKESANILPVRWIRLPDREGARCRKAPHEKLLTFNFLILYLILLP